MDLDGRRVLEFKHNIRSEYSRYSVVQRILHARRSRDDRDLAFVQIGSRFHIPASILVSPQGFELDVAPNVVGIGQSIAIGEENYLVRSLRSFISNKEEVEDLSFETVVGSLNMHNLSRPRSALIPLSFYSALHLGKFEKMSVDYDQYDPYLVLGKKRVRVYWSNNYVPFDEIFFIGNEIGEWVVKPDPSDQEDLTIEVQGERDGKFDVVIKTVASFSGGNSGEGLIMTICSPRAG